MSTQEREHQVRAQHSPMSGGIVCVACKATYPCPAILLADEVSKLAGVERVASLLPSGRMAEWYTTLTAKDAEIARQAEELTRLREMRELVRPPKSLPATSEVIYVAFNRSKYTRLRAMLDGTTEGAIRIVEDNSLASGSAAFVSADGDTVLIEAAHPRRRSRDVRLIIEMAEAFGDDPLVVFDGLVEQAPALGEMVSLHDFVRSVESVCHNPMANAVTVEIAWHAEIARRSGWEEKE